MNKEKWSSFGAFCLASTALLLAGYLLSVGLVFSLGGRIILPTEKTTFTGTRNFEGPQLKNVFLSTWPGNGRRHVVSLRPNVCKVSIEVEPNLKVGSGITLISLYTSWHHYVLPVTTKERISGIRVVIWVPSDEDKVKWENWIREAENEYQTFLTISYQKPQATRIIPE